MATLLELIIATVIAGFVFNAGHPVWAVVVWIGIVSCGNAAQQG